MMLDTTVRDRLGTALADVVDDYEEWRPPFSDNAGITTPITDRFDTDREAALFLTLTTALNRQRDAERLYSRFERLWYEEPWIFDPETLVGEDRFEDLRALFEAEGVRFHRKDAEAWYEVSRTLYYYYDGDPMTLFRAHDYEMPAIAEQVVEASGDTRFYGDNFPILRGEKIRPMWLRLVDNQVHSLSGIGGSDIPVDTHVASFTGRLLGVDLTTAEADKQRARRFWRRVCENRAVRPIDVDGPIWYLDRDWDEWGRRYFEGALHDAGLDLAPDGLAARRPSGVSEQV